jgi:hypothetical protein
VADIVAHLSSFSTNRADSRHLYNNLLR